MIFTDMTNETVIALMKGQIDSLAEWKMDTYVVQSSGHQAADSDLFGLKGLSVSIQDENSVKEAAAMINSMLER